MESKRPIYFISDLHLGTTYDATTRQRENLVVEFLESIADKAGALYMVGDILDYWFEYRTVVPTSYVSLLPAQSRRLAIVIRNLLALREIVNIIHIV